MAFMAMAEGAGAAEAGSAGAASAGAGSAGAARGAAGDAASATGGQSGDGSVKKLVNSSSAGKSWQKMRHRAKGSGSTPRTKPEHIPTTEEVEEGTTSADLEEREGTSAPAQQAKGPGVVAKLDRIDGVHSGSGFVLGLMAWVVATNYMQGGLPQVKKLLAAKFLNK